MLTVVCGEDVQKARDYYRSLLENASKKGVGHQYVNKNDLVKIAGDGFAPASLFEEKKIYVIEKLNKQMGRKNSKEAHFIALADIEKNTDIELLAWEGGVQKRAIKYAGKTAKVKEFKPSINVFQLQDAAVPGNMEAFCRLLDGIHEAGEDMFAYVMLTRHVRNLLLAKRDELPTNLAPWMGGKIKSQAKKWELEPLTEFYKRLIGIEISLKSGKLSYSIAASIQLTACYFLR